MPAVSIVICFFRSFNALVRSGNCGFTIGSPPVITTISAGPMNHSINYFRYGEFFALIGVPGILCIAPFAADRATRQTNKYAWRSCQQPFSLNRMKNFVYYHFKRMHRPVLNRFFCADDSANIINRVFKSRVVEALQPNPARIAPAAASAFPVRVIAAVCQRIIHA